MRASIREVHHTMQARSVDEHTFALDGDQRKRFRVGQRIQIGHPPGRHGEVASAVYANGVTRVTVDLAAPGSEVRPGPSHPNDAWTRIALRVHGLMARAAGAATRESPGIIHDARRYDWMWGWLFGRSDAAIIRLLGIRDGDRVLEVGCGPGNLARSLRAAVGADGRVGAIDASPEMIELARRKARGAAIELGVARAEQLPYPDATFNVVVSRLVLHEIEDLETALAEVRRVLVPGGRCLLIDLPGHALDAARTTLDSWGGPVGTGTVGFPFFRYVSCGLDRG